MGYGKLLFTESKNELSPLVLSYRRMSWVTCTLRRLSTPEIQSKASKLARRSDTICY